MKRFSLFLLLTLSATACLHAYDFRVGCFHYNITNRTLPPFTVELAKLEDEQKELREIVVPETITYHDTTYQVTRIDGGAFYKCAHITSISLPNTIVGIAEDAFAFCKGLTKITLPDGVQYIGFNAFEGCESLTSIVIPERVTTIGERAFMKCSQLSNITILESVNSVGRDAFKGTPWYDSLPDGVVYINNVLYAYKGKMTMTKTAIKVRNGTTDIVDYAFKDCIGLTSIALPKTIKTIGEGAFCNCHALASIVIPKGVTHIERATFSDCYSLAHVLLPEGLTDIDNAAFQSCQSLVSITIPQTVQQMGDFAFRNCYALTDIHLSEGLTAIGENAFNNCRSLISITIPNSVTRFGPKHNRPLSKPEYIGVFMDCISLQSVHIGNGITAISVGDFRGCTSLSSVHIPNSVTTIGEQAFQNCTSLSVMDIPKSVTQIGMGAFEGTAWYQAQPDGEVYINNILYAYKGIMPKKTSIAIKEGTTWITDFAFVDCANLVSVTIPKTVTHIGKQAFSGCKNLKAVALAEGVSDIGLKAFMDCKSLKEITIPQTVITIGYNAFSGTPWYKKKPNGFVYINDVLYACKGEDTQPESYAVREGTVSISLYVFSECEQLKSVTLPASLRSIDPPIFDWRNPPEYVVCLAPTPPAGIQQVFTAKRLYVPDSAVEAYRAVIDEHVEILPLSEKPNE
ncbi:MAG: leucine-rich repeat domain-containing protein [Paludibacteraceae bacterium]